MGFNWFINPGTFIQYIDYEFINEYKDFFSLFPVLIKNHHAGRFYNLFKQHIMPVNSESVVFISNT